MLHQMLLTITGREKLVVTIGIYSVSQYLHLWMVFIRKIAT